MTAESLRIFGCPTCGFRIGDRDSSCPRCGYSFAQGTKFECPFCGDLVDHGVSTCPSCHVNYSEFKEKTVARGGDEAIDQLLLDIIELEAQSAGHETKKFSCPSCSLLLEGTEAKCPRCGKDFEEDVSFQCPICGSSVSANVSQCPECGSSFEESAESEEVAETESALDSIAEHAEAEPRVVVEEREEPMSATRVEPAPQEAPVRVRAPEPEPEPEPVPEPEPESAPKAVEDLSNTVDQIASALDELTDEVEEEQKPRVFPKPLAKPKQIVTLKTVEPEPEPTPKKAAPSGAKKTKQRKLKAKSPGQKSKQ